ncbi:MAG: response regulator [Cyanobacteria bacterium J055]|nr:MAG: response regulator [Cyanobacteria bacterium J055]
MDDIIQLDSIKHQLRNTMRSKKPKMLVVDDEPDNLDLLYRTFRRDFQGSKAESGFEALEILEKEGEVAVIISDQRMPEMKGTEFLSKTLPQFPNTFRIILTGFTDIEDLVEAINSGQVYKYITKPWDPQELKEVVGRAADTYELLKQRTEELARSQAQMELLKAVLRVAQDDDCGETGLAAIAQAFGEEFAADTCILQLVSGDTLGTAGSYRRTGTAQNWLNDDPLVQEAISQKTVRVVANIPNDANLSAVAHYQSSGIQAHLAIPILWRDRAIGLLSLQWMQPCQLQESKLELVYLAAQQVGLALVSMNCG